MGGFHIYRVNPYEPRVPFPFLYGSCWLLKWFCLAHSSLGLNFMGGMWSKTSKVVLRATAGSWPFPPLKVCNYYLIRRRMKPWWQGRRRIIVRGGWLFSEKISSCKMRRNTWRKRNFENLRLQISSKLWVPYAPIPSAWSGLILGTTGYLEHQGVQET